MQVGRWGNSLAIRLPTSLVQLVGLREGDKVTVALADRNSHYTRCDQVRAQALARLRRLNWDPPSRFAFIRSDLLDNAAVHGD